MRKLFTTAVAAALMGLGVSSSVMASVSPIQAVYDAAPLLAGSGDFGYNAVAGALDDGSQLAGLVNAYNLGVSGIGERIDELSDQIIAYNQEDFSETFYGAAAYGLASVTTTDRSATAAENTSVLTTFYTTGYQSVTGGASTIQDYAEYVGSVSGVPTDVPNPTGADNQLVYDLAYHVLATNRLGLVTANDAFADTLFTELGYFDTTVGDPEIGETSPTTILALSLWALETSGYANNVALTGSGNWAGSTLADLLAELTATLDADIAAGAVYTEDLSYGILALEAYGMNATVYKELLASGVENPGLDPGTPFGAVPQQVGTAVDYSTIPVGNVYAGAALQALPEPASLSLLALGGMALLTRRRRA